MRCKEFENKIIDYLESNLPHADMERMEEHKEECRNCNRLYSEIRQTYGMLDNERIPVLQDGFFERVQAKKRQSRNTTGRVITLNRVYAAAAAIAIMVGLALGIMLGSNLADNRESLADNEHIYYMDSIASDFYLNTEQTASLETYLVEEE